MFNLIKQKPFFFVLVFSFLIRIFYLSINWPLWWDAHVYIGMGKYIFTGGEIGIWESFRPLIHPFLIGLIWKLGLNPIAFGKILDLLFSLIAIAAFYKIVKQVSDKKTAFFSSLIFSVTPIFLMHTGMILTEPLAMTFGLLGLYLLLGHQHKTKIFLAGVLLSLAFLTKFTLWTYIAGVAIVLLFNKETLWGKTKNIFFLGVGFLLPLIPYLILNQYKYGNILEPFLSGSMIVGTATWLYGQGWSYYFLHFFLSNPIFLFSIYYGYLFFRRKIDVTGHSIITLTITILTLVYFIFIVPRKEPRYLVIIIPFLAFFAVKVILMIYENLKQQQKPFIKPKAFLLVVLLLLLVPMPANLSFESAPAFRTEIQQIITEKNITGTIVSSDPSFVSFLDNKIITLDGMEFAAKIYGKLEEPYQLIFINDCDLICKPKDNECVSEKAELLAQIEIENKEIFNKTIKTCNYKIYLPLEND